MAYGLSPVKNTKGGITRSNNFTDGNGYRIAATAPSAYFEGDLVTLTSGLLVTDMAGASPGAVVGVFWGAEYQDNSTGNMMFVRSIPTGTVAKAQYKAYVYDDPDTMFIAQADQDTTAIDATKVGNNVQIVAAPTGSAITHKSGLTVDSNTAATANAGFPLTILGSGEVDMSYTAAGTVMQILCKINTHQFGIAAGNAGI